MTFGLDVPVARRIVGSTRATVGKPRGRSSAGRRGGSLLVCLHAGSTCSRGERVRGGTVRSWPRWTHSVRAGTSSRRESGGLYGVLGPSNVAGPRRVARHRDRLDVPCRIGAGNGDQRRGKTPALQLCVRNAGRGARRPQDGCPQPAVACGARASGARFEGVLREWSPSWAPGEEGMLRDSAMFSVIAAEWPTVKSALALRIIHSNAGPC